MKEWYTLDELLESCGVTKSQYIKPKLTWDTLTFQDMIDYYEGNDKSEEMFSCLGRLGELLHYRISGSQKDEVILGELWYDKEDFQYLSPDEFEDLVADFVDSYFEMQTYLSYTITNILMTEEYHTEQDFDGYRIVAYGNKVEVNLWNNEIKYIFKKFFQ